MPDTIRIIRILEYVGPRDILEKQLEQNQVKGFRYFGQVTIREAICGTFPEIVSE